VKIIDRYILKKFLSAFFFTVILLVAIICVIDFTEKNDDFINSHAPFNLIVKYYLNFAPYIANMLSPITVFIATVFVTAKMASHTEIIAILNGGISFRRMLLPYLMGSTMIAVFIFILIGWLLPKANKERVAFENVYVKDQYFYEGRNVHLKIAPETYVYMESYNNQINTGYQFTLETIDGKDLISKLKAMRITWMPGKNKWELENYMIRSFKNGKESIQFGVRTDTTINLYPKDFESTYLLHETFTLPELKAYIQELRDKGVESVAVYEIEMYERYTYPFAIIILTVIGVVVSARKTREGAGFQIAFGFLLAFIYIIFVIMSRSIANAGTLSPLMAAWLPNLIFASIGFIMYKTLPR
jgi:lipopolysaccharide export system permease protein